MDSWSCSTSQGFLYKAELLDQNSDSLNFDVNLYALGHGAFTTGGSTIGWNGDPGEKDETSLSDSFRADVAGAGSIKTVRAHPGSSFESGETWDRSDAAEATLSLTAAQKKVVGRLIIDQDTHLECNDLPQY